MMPCMTACFAPSKDDAISRWDGWPSTAMRQHRGLTTIRIGTASPRPSSPPRPIAAAGDALLRQGHLDGARALYEQAVDTDDRSAEGRLGLARVALATGHADEAEAEGRRAVTLRPSAIG